MTWYESYYGYDPNNPMEDTGWRGVEPYFDYIKMWINEVIEVDDKGQITVIESRNDCDNFVDKETNNIISEVYDTFFLRDFDSAVEDAYDVMNIDLDEPGRYAISAEVTLTYEVGGIWENVKTEDWDMNFEDAEVTFLPRDSFAENVKVQKIS